MATDLELAREHALFGRQAAEHLRQLGEEDASPPLVQTWSVSPGGDPWTLNSRQKFGSFGILNTSPFPVLVTIANTLPLTGIPSGAFVVLPIRVEGLVSIFTLQTEGSDGGGLLFLFPSVKSPVWDVPVTAGILQNGAVVCTDHSADVDITSSVVLAGNALRRGTQWCNDGAHDIYLGLDAPAVEGQGIYLRAGGGTWDGMISTTTWGGDVAAIAIGGAGHLTIVETT